MSNLYVCIVCVHVPMCASMYAQVCNQFNCPKLTYYLKPEMQERTARNAFDVLMQSRNERRLPAKVDGDKLRGDQRMCNDLLGALNIGWPSDIVGSAGGKCVKVRSMVHRSMPKAVC